MFEEEENEDDLMGIIVNDIEYKYSSSKRELYDNNTNNLVAILLQTGKWKFI